MMKRIIEWIDDKFFEDGKDVTAEVRRWHVVKQALSEGGAKGGSARTDAKAEAARANGLKSKGRPKKKSEPVVE